MSEKPHKTLNDSALQSFVGEAVKLTGRADLAAFDPLAAKHTLFLDGSDRSAELAVLDRYDARRIKKTEA